MISIIVGTILAVWFVCLLPGIILNQKAYKDEINKQAKALIARQDNAGSQWLVALAVVVGAFIASLTTPVIGLPALVLYVYNAVQLHEEIKTCNKST
jgi:divalent metal cation (Fe/Co/Zn/Cd) transporter